eukprot:906708_1
MGCTESSDSDSDSELDSITEESSRHSSFSGRTRERRASTRHSDHPIWAEQFSNTREALEFIRDSFYELSESHRKMHRRRVFYCLTRLGVRPGEIQPEAIKRIFEFEDFEGTITFQRFMQRSIADLFADFVADDKSDAPQLRMIRRGCGLVRRAFDSIDDDGSGSITFAEMRTSDYFSYANDDELTEIFRKMDADN